MVFESSLDSTEILWEIFSRLFVIVGLDEAIASGQMKSIQNELECIEESGYAKFLAIEMTRARYALQVSANSFDRIIPSSCLFNVYYGCYYTEGSPCTNFLQFHKFFGKF